MKAAFCTLGCKVNQYETEAMITLFKKRGYEIVDFSDLSDIYVINTCTVTGTGDRKSRQMIHRAHSKNESAIIVVAGCYSQVAPQEINKIEGVSLIIGTNDRSKVVELTEEYINNKSTESIIDVGDIMKERKYEDLWISSYEDRTRAFVKIEEGCTQFCSYCIIPYARGPVRSRSLSSIHEEAVLLSGNGYKEIVLTGIHIGSYGRDLKGTSLIDAIKTVNDVDGIERIRLGSIEPRTLSEEFIMEISKMPKVCDHFHISLQSGCDETLKRMNRKYTTKQFMQSVENLRKHFSNPAITTDIITGFPLESEEEFNQSLLFMDKIRFSEAHIFPYSQRKGTKAAQMDGQIEKHIKEERAKKMIARAKELHKEYINCFLGETAPVLFERNIKEDIFEGHMTNYIKVRVHSKDDITHKICNVKIVRCGLDNAEGILC